MSDDNDKTPQDQTPEAGASPWDNLIKDLGVEPAADSERPKPPEPAPTPPRARELPPPPEPKAGDWDSLAGELGLDVPKRESPPAISQEKTAAAAEPASTVERATKAPETKVPEAKTKRSKSSDPAKKAAADPELEEMFAAFAQPAEPASADSGRDKPPTVKPAEARQDSQAEVERSYNQEVEPIAETVLDEPDLDEPDEVESPTAEATEEETAEEAPAKRPSLSGDAARSAFDALFASGAALFRGRKKPAAEEPTATPGGAKLGDDSRAKELDATSDATSATDDFGAGLVSDEAGKSESSKATEGDEEERPKRRRRRRGGRGSRRRAKGDEAAKEGDEQDSDQSADEESRVERPKRDDQDSSEDGQRPKRKRRRRRKRSADRETSESGTAETSGSESADDLDDDQDGEESSGSGRGRRNSHRNIPTWSEAISVMVDVNLESRKNAPSRPSGGRGRGGRGGRGRSGKGRGRGQSSSS